jgi:TonB family protein
MAVTVSAIPQHRRMTAAIYAFVVVLHIAVIAVLIWAARHQPERLRHSGSTTGSIAAYNPGPVGTTGRAPTPAPKKTPARVMRAEVAKPEPSGGAGQSSAGGDTQGAGSGPVRLGSGESLTLLRKVIPIYPRMFEAARFPGTVVLDAIIHQDGTIGDVHVLQSTNDQFAQAAVAAVKQWLYSPIPFEGIVTVTVNFTPR